ncbi:MAG: hypothetical protein JJU28_17090 [Cyclobacteriaceae bacterium]|nr:hypothetical protein [Cyclobacteriaceae bacterium]
MNRRIFVKKGSMAVCAPAALSMMGPASLAAVLHDSAASAKPEWLIRLIHLNDDQIKEALKHRISDADHPSFGGFADAFDIVTSHGTANFIKMALCSLLSPESNYYHNTVLSSQITDATRWLLKIQNADGSIDLHSTNFNSPPDTGFIVKWLGPPCKMLMESQLPNKQKLIEPLKSFLQKAGNTLIYGGIHTPNHRWVVCAALGWLHMLWPDQRYVQRAEQWLAEGIDIDEDGQYDERSTYIYTPLTNRTLIVIARAFNKPELLQYVRKNLEMSMYYMHPNGEVATEASGRQDKALQGTMESYYFPYRFMALHDANGTFAAMCKVIEQTAFEQIRYSSLHNILEDKSLWKPLPGIKPLPDNYVKEFKKTGIVRIRRGNYDASLISMNPVFFTMHKGNAVLQGIRVASAFFGKGQFTAEDIVKEGDVWILRRSLQGPYYQPLEANQVTGDNDWKKVPRSFRKTSEVQHLETEIRIREIAGGFELDIRIDGTDKVPVTVEMIFRPGGSFSGLEPSDALEDTWLLKGESATYSQGEDRIQFGPGACAHKWLRLRGALPSMGTPAVFLTGFTPFHHKLTLS